MRLIDEAQTDGLWKQQYRAGDDRGLQDGSHARVSHPSADKWTIGMIGSAGVYMTAATARARIRWCVFVLDRYGVTLLEKPVSCGRNRGNRAAPQGSYFWVGVGIFSNAAL